VRESTLSEEVMRITVAIVGALFVFIPVFALLVFVSTQATEPYPMIVRLIWFSVAFFISLAAAWSSFRASLRRRAATKKKSDLDTVVEKP